MAQLVTVPAMMGAGAISGAVYAAYSLLKPKIVFSVDAPGSTQVEGEGIPRRYYASPERLLTNPSEDVNTVHDILLHSAKKRPDGHAFGTRPLVKIHVEEKEVKNSEGKVEKKKWSYMELGNYEFKTYKQVLEEVLQVGTALTSEECGSLKKGNMFGIYAETSAQWLSTAHGCFAQSLVVVTIYANLGEEGLIHAINDTELTHLLTDASLLPALFKVTSKVPKLKYVFYTTHREKADEKVIAQFKEGGVTVLPYDFLVETGKKSTPKSNPPQKDELAVIMYTSGTTGVPKGVMITHANIVSSVAGANESVAKKFNICSDDTYCSFLPLAHILELVVEHVIMFLGGTLAFGNPRTMTDNLVKNCKGDLVSARPTLMAGVPVLWERIRKGALEKIKHSGWLTQTVFNAAFNYKYFMLEHGYDNTSIVNHVIFKKFQEQVGGRLRGLVSGGAPLSKSTHQFLRVVFSVPAIQGYGLTETTGLIAAQPVDSLSCEVAGAPIPCGEVKLVDCKEMNYTSQDKPFPRGEIWARGPQITKGYYKQPEKTKEEYKDGWFATGDIGQWNADGTLSIVDRKKNLVKLSHGEYIALESMESKYKQDHFVEEICIVANSQKDLPAAIVVPNKKALQEWASSNGLGDKEWHELCKDKKTKEAVKQSLHQTAGKEKMKTFEKPSDVFLVDDEWTVENGLMTSAMKLKRNEIQQKYKKEIKELFPEDA